MRCCLLLLVLVAGCTEHNPGYGESGTPDQGGPTDGGPAVEGTVCQPGAFVSCTPRSSLLRCSADGSRAQEIPCPHGCNSDDQRCNDCDSDAPPFCDQKTAVRCVDGKVVQEACTRGCREGQCRNCDTQSYYPDADKDGFGDENAEPVEACEPLAGHVTNGDDCDDHDVEAHPGQQGFFGRPTQGNQDYDFDCDGNEEQQLPDTAACAAMSNNSCGGSGWVFSVPDCGQFATFGSCAKFAGACTPANFHQEQQNCR